MQFVAALRRLAVVAIVAACTFAAAGVPYASSAEPGEIARLIQTIREADRNGDEQQAVQAAEQCASIVREGQFGPYASLPDPYCLHRLASALRDGRGVARDEKRAFDLFKELTAAFPDDDALDLTLAYLDGRGTARDPLEAGVTFWRVEHGAWSVYSDTWGMCDDCKQLWDREKLVGKRIDRELTVTERHRVDAIAAARFPGLMARVQHRDRQLSPVTAGEFAMIGLFCYWLFRRTRATRFKSQVRL